MGRRTWDTYFQYLQWHHLLLAAGLLAIGVASFVGSLVDPELPVWFGLGWLFVVGMFTGMALRQTAAAQRRRALERTAER